MRFREIVDLIAGMLQELVSPVRAPTGSKPSARRVLHLTDREREVLRLVSEGGTNKEIGRTLYVSPATVSFHLTSIFGKLGVHTRAQAVAVAMRDKLFSPHL